MIDYKDLMIGNWVYESDNGFPMYVVSVGDDYCYLDFDGNEGDVWEGEDKDMMPIEVTEELLVKIGLKHNAYIPEVYEEFETEINNCLISVQNRLTNSKDRYWVCEVRNEKRYVMGSFDFQYLHELQNGIRLITKGDLEVCL